MKLIEEQVRMIKEEIAKLSQDIHSLNYSKDRQKPTYFTRPADSDYNSIIQIQQKAIRIKELMDILKRSTVIKNPNSETVEIGSKFNVFLKYGKDDADMIHVTLIENKVTIESSFNYITIHSNIGKAIWHKKIGSRFRYRDANGKRVEGLITSMEYEREGIGKTRLRMKRDK